jgi:hypothetical protein
MQVDADQIFLSDHNDESNFDAGSGVAAAYDLGQDWIQEWGYPFAITSAIHWKMARRGILRHAQRPHSRRRATRRPWSEVTKEMSQFINKEWMIEMFSGGIEAHRHGIKMSVIRMMLSTAWLDGLASRWEQAPDGTIRRPKWVVWGAHYCQLYKIGNFTLSKYDNKETDICKRTSSATATCGCYTSEPVRRTIDACYYVWITELLLTCSYSVILLFRLVAWKGKFASVSVNQARINLAKVDGGASEYRTLYDVYELDESIKCNVSAARAN